MASSYASVISLMHVLNRIQHPSCPVSLDKLHKQSLFDKVNFLIDFLENHFQSSSEEAEHLCRKIADAAFAAEDTIESFVVDQILAKSEGNKDVGFKESSYSLFCQDLSKNIQDMDIILDEVKDFKEKKSEKCQLPRSSKPVPSIEPPFDKSTVVKFDDDLVDLLTKDQSSRQIIPVVGMGGIGKTTLARNVYNHPFIVHHFHVRAWATISQDHSVYKIIHSLLRNIGVGQNEISRMDDEQLREQLHKGLYGRKYLIVLDDVWSSVAWDEIRRFIPDNNNGSRILLTTRQLNVAFTVGSGRPYEMKFLNDDQSWDLLSATIFGQEACPLELEKCGKRIAKNCKGLPLAIVVIGGLLKTSQKTPEYWDHVAENVSSIVNAQNNEHCLNVLSFSYNHLPAYLKPCFLSMGIFEEDEEVVVSFLTKLWVAEGFLKPIDGKTLEEVALEYLYELIRRNLVMTNTRGLSGNLKNCGLHDLVRDLCLKEAKKDMFFCVIK